MWEWSQSSPAGGVGLIWDGPKFKFISIWGCAVGVFGGQSSFSEEKRNLIRLCVSCDLKLYEQGIFVL